MDPSARELNTSRIDPSLTVKPWTCLDFARIFIEGGVHNATKRN
jgi:hypothetical protein